MKNEEEFQKEFQKRLRQRISARKSSLTDKFKLAGDVSGTGLLAGVSTQGFPAYAPAFAGLFAASVVMKVYNIVQDRKKLVNSINIDEFKEDFINSELQVKEYMKKYNLNEEEQQEFLNSFLNKQPIEQSVANMIDYMMGEETMIEAQVNYIAHKKKMKPK